MVKLRAFLVALFRVEMGTFLFLFASALFCVALFSQDLMVGQCGQTYPLVMDRDKGG